MSLFHELEKQIDEKLRSLFRSGAAPTGGREIVELQRLVLDRIGDRIETLPRAKRAFPFNSVAVRIPYADEARRPGLEIVFASDDALGNDVREYLRREGAEFPEDLAVSVALYMDSGAGDPSVVCSNIARQQQTPPVAAPPPKIRLQWEAGSVEVEKGRIHLGRLSDVLDDRHRLVRRNDVAIEHNTVSRAHAHIEWDGAGQEFRVFDDGSSYGTGVLQSGRLIEVPSNGSRGIRVGPGDEIYIGQIRIRVEPV